MTPARQLARTLRRGVRTARRATGSAVAVAVSKASHAELALFHEFAAAPSGGGNQFLRALAGELQRRGLQVERNRLGRTTRAALLNSFNFDAGRVRRLIRPDVRVAHRIDGPVAAYRGFDDGADELIAAINAEFAEITIVQSQYSLRKHRELGISLRDPVVIPNAVDPGIFYPPPARRPRERPLRLIASSWSDNRGKGSETLQWLDAHLEDGRVVVTFVGRTQATFRRIRSIGAVDSVRLAALLREHDAYIAPSVNDPCSNALLEALACGLPAIYRASGGHPEIVGDAGVPFAHEDELPAAIERLEDEYETLRAAISVPTIDRVADEYLAALEAEGAEW
jgi:glycosyltransferase involved in cell wall biosynthesis